MLPHPCPICHGRGTVARGFYGDSTAIGPERCRSCHGTGIVWGPEPVTLPVGSPPVTPPYGTIGNPARVPPPETTILGVRIVTVPGLPEGAAFWVPRGYSL